LLIAVVQVIVAFRQNLHSAPLAHRREDLLVHSRVRRVNLYLMANAAKERIVPTRFWIEVVEKMINCSNGPLNCFRKRS